MEANDSEEEVFRNSLKEILPTFGRVDRSIDEFVGSRNSFGCENKTEIFFLTENKIEGRAREGRECKKAESTELFFSRLPNVGGYWLAIRRCKKGRRDRETGQDRTAAGNETAIRQIE